MHTTKAKDTVSCKGCESIRELAKIPTYCNKLRTIIKLNRLLLRRVDKGGKEKADTYGPVSSVNLTLESWAEIEFAELADNSLEMADRMLERCPELAKICPEIANKIL